MGESRWGVKDGKYKAPGGFVTVTAIDVAGEPMYLAPLHMRNGPQYPAESGCRHAMRAGTMLFLPLVLLSVCLRAQDGARDAENCDSIAVVTTTAGAVYMGCPLRLDADSVLLRTPERQLLVLPRHSVRRLEMAPAQVLARPPMVFTKMDGAQLVGWIARGGTDTLHILSVDGRAVALATSDIRSTELPENMDPSTGTYTDVDADMFENPMRMRYMIGPSAFGPHPGEGYYLNTDIVLQTAAVGITEGFSFSAALLPIPGGSLLYLFPRVTFPSPAQTLSLSAGVAFILFTEEHDATQMLLPYGVMTIGSSDNNLSIGVGFVTGLEETGVDTAPLLSIACMTRMSRSFALVLEGWRGHSDGLFTAGVRFLGRTLSVEGGIITSVGEPDGQFLNAVFSLWNCAAENPVSFYEAIVTRGTIADCTAQAGRKVSGGRIPRRHRIQGRGRTVL
jgi:hypothetical protein